MNKPETTVITQHLYCAKNDKIIDFGFRVSDFGLLKNDFLEVFYKTKSFYPISEIRNHKSKIIFE